MSGKNSEAQAALRALALAAVDNVRPDRATIDAVPTGALSQAALLAHRRGHPDLAVLVLAHLSRRSPPQFARVFPQIVTSGDRLRALVRCLRSGAAGRQSLGTRAKAMVRDWIDRASLGDLLLAAVGSDPSLGDILRMVHPRPATAERAALYRWIIGRHTDPAALPEALGAFLTFRQDLVGDPPEVPLELFLPLKQPDRPWAGLDPAQWSTLARRLPVADLARRANLLHRRGAFADPATLALAAARLADAAALQAAGLGPVRLFALLRALDAVAPQDLRNAFATAVETALDAAPATTAPLTLCVNVSGIMTRSAMLRPYGGAIAAVHGHEAADLLTAALTRGNRAARFMTYSDTASEITRAPEGPLPSRVKSRNAIRYGISHAATPLTALAAQRKPVDTVVIVTANSASGLRPAEPQALSAAWARIRAHNPKARLLYLRLRPDIPDDVPTTLPEGPGVLNLTGFSDAVLLRIRDFLAGRDETGYLSEDVEASGGMRG